MYQRALIRSLIIFGSLAGLWPATVSLAGPNHWTSNGPAGGFINALAADPSNPRILYAATLLKVYKSMDQGKSWRPVGGGLPEYPQSLAVSSRGDLFVGANGVYRSRDGGMSWTRLDYTVFGARPAAPDVLMIDPSDPDTVYAGHCGVGVAKTVDGGDHWGFNTSSSPNIVAFAFDPKRPQTIYAADAGGCRVFPSAMARKASGDSGGVWKTVDGGLHWVLLDSSPASVQSVCVDPSKPGVIYAGLNLPDPTGHSVFRSSDGGATWQTAGSGIAQESVVYALSFDPSESGTLYAGTSNGVYKSLDGGQSWSCWVRGLGGRSVRALVQTAGPSPIFAGTLGGGVYESFDAAATWSLAAAEIREARVASVAVDPANAATVYAGLDGGGVFRSEDGGLSWIWASTGLTDSSIHALVISPRDASSVYAGTDRGVFRSHDGARSWSSTSLSDPVFVLQLDAASGTIYAATTGGVDRSDDDGETWTLGSIGLPQPRSLYGLTTLALDPASQTTIYTATYNGGGLFRSTDRGSHWSSVAEFRDTILSLALPIRPSGTILAGAGGVFRSEDGGATWTGPLGPFQSVRALLVDVTDSSTVYSATDCYYGLPDCGGVFRSLDGGRLWDSFGEGLLGQPVHALALDRTGNSFYAGTDSGVFALTLAPERIPVSQPRAEPRALRPR